MADALTRGIRLFRILEKHRDLRLEELAAQSGIPKASAMRLLGSLEAVGMIVRNPSDKKYRVAARILSLEGGRVFEEKMDRVLEDLCEKSGEVVEWWIPSEGRMVMFKRSVPRNREVVVSARPGFMYPQRQLETVIRLGAACLGVPLLPEKDLCTFTPAGKHRPLKQKEMAGLLESAGAGEAYDAAPNDNGVRRIGLVLEGPDGAAGVLAIAVAPSSAGRDLPQDFRTMLHAAKEKMAVFIG